MREFERIRIEKGLAYFRDTGILVSEVVNDLKQGKSLQDVLGDYPAITADDIVEALVLTTESIKNDIWTWRNEGLMPIITIEGYSAILAGKHGDIKLTDEQRAQFIEIIYVHSRRAIAAWNHLTTSVKVNHDTDHHDWQVVPFSKILHEVQRGVPQNEPNATIMIDAPDNLPSVRASFYLASAIVNLAIDRINYLENKHTILKISTDTDDTFLTIRLQRHAEMVFEVSPEGNAVYHVGLPFLIAEQIIQQHLSELKVRQTGDEVTFEFQLPVWKEENK